MDVRHLELLRELADRGTVTAVAQATFRTPSAVSQQLRTAQREAGVPLVEPDGRRLRLTEAGRLLARGAADVAAAMTRVQADLDRLRGEPRGTVRIGTLPSAGEALLPGLLARLSGREIDLVLDDFDLSEAGFGQRTRDHDVVIGHAPTGRRPAASEGLAAWVLAVEPLDVALPANHRLAERDSLQPGDLADDPWIGVPDGYPFDTLLTAVENAAGRPFVRVQRLRDNHLVATLVACGVGVALLPRFTTPTREGMVTRPLTGVRATRDIVALAQPDTAERAAVQIVLEGLRDAGAELSPEADGGRGGRR